MTAPLDEQPNDGHPASTPPERRRARTDPAAMRETLDAARRRLGPSDHHTTPQSAEVLRALLREAANQSTVSSPYFGGAADPGPPASDDPGTGAGRPE